MKLYNRTKINDGVLSALLVSAGLSIGARTSGVIVNVNMSRGPHSSGTAYECCALKINKRWVKTDGGYFDIRIPRGHPDPIKAAQCVLYVARHEWGHIRDYQAGGRLAMEFAKKTNGRRPKHDSRPEEIRAENYIYDSDAKLKPGHFDDVILDLAAELESLR